MFDWKTFYKNIEIKTFARKRKAVPSSWVNIKFKYYQRFRHIPFPQKTLKASSELEKLLSKRKSSRTLLEKFNEHKLFKIIYFSLGIKHKGKDFRKESKRFYPSAGARYPTECYLIVSANISKTVSKGIYHFSVLTNELELIEKSFTKQDLKTIFAQEFLQSCPVIVVLTSVINRSYDKYSDRSYNYSLLEAGHIAQNISLIAEHYKVNSCCVCGFKDDKLHEFIKIIDPEEIPTYCIALGKNVK